MSVVEACRKRYHQRLFDELVELRNEPPVPNMADKDSRVSVALAEGMCRKIDLPMTVKKRATSGQKLGSRFGDYTSMFLEESFGALTHLRPGEWVYSTSQSAGGIAVYDQYGHLAEIRKVLAENAEMKAALGGDYFITPDIVVARKPVSDQQINEKASWLSESSDLCANAPLRSSNQESLLLHASVSCKWSIRSDRSQNSRTEALNLIRNRKGRTPHIAVVTFEPLPSRIASIALGTGDIDCTYHVALPELMAAAAESPSYEDALGLLTDMVQGRRLRDISDLPLDLAV